MKRLLLILIALAMIAVCSSCSDEDESTGSSRSGNTGKNSSSAYSELVGTWTAVSGDTHNASMVLYSDGACSLTSKDGEVDNGTWKVTDGTLQILGTIDGRFWYTDSMVGVYSLKNGELRISNPIVDGKQSSTDVVFTRATGEQQASSSGSTDQLVGSWKWVSGDTRNTAMTLYSNGTCTVTATENETEAGTWTVVDGQLRIIGTINGQFWLAHNMIGSYSVSGNELRLIRPLIDSEQLSEDVVFVRSGSSADPGLFPEQEKNSGPTDTPEPLPQPEKSSGSADQLAGTWQETSGNTHNASMVLYSDGSCMITSKDGEVDNGTWEVTDGTLQILGTISGQFWFTDSLIGVYSVSGDELRIVRPIVSGEQISADVVFTRTGRSRQDGSSGSPDQLIGSWRLAAGNTQDAAITFFSGGACTVTTGGNETENGTWTVVDGTLRIIGTLNGQFWSAENLIGSFSVSGDELRLIRPLIDSRQSPEDVVYVRGNGGTAAVTPGSQPVPTEAPVPEPAATDTPRPEPVAAASAAPAAVPVSSSSGVGDLVTFGHYEQDNNPDNGREPIEWIVLDVQDGQTLLLSRYALDARPYHTENADVTWESSSLRAWLNSGFMNTAFSGKEQRALQMTVVDNSNAQRAQPYDGYFEGTGGNDTWDYVFLLSYYEANERYSPVRENSICVPTDYAVARGAMAFSEYQGKWRTGVTWWLRSTGGGQDWAECVGSDGTGSQNMVGESGCCVRPAVWVKTEKITASREPALYSAPLMSPGGTVFLGKYQHDEGSYDSRYPIEWTILEVRDGKALLLSKEGLETRPYHSVNADATWETCSLRNWLNHDFLNTAFSETERKLILATDVDNSPAQGWDGWATSGGNNTRDQVFLLSYREAFGVYFTSDEARMCAPTGHATENGAETSNTHKVNGRPTGLWWLRSPGDDQSAVAFVDYDGSLDQNIINGEDLIVRPAVWIDLNQWM